MKTRSGIAPCLRPFLMQDRCQSGVHPKSRGYEDEPRRECRDFPHWCSDLDARGLLPLDAGQAARCTMRCPEVFESVTFVTRCKGCGVASCFGL